MKHIAMVALTLASLAVGPALAATKTITLSVPDMDCAVCPITVRAALTKVKGVVKAEASLEKREAVVTFDDAKPKSKRSPRRLRMPAIHRR